MPKHRKTWSWRRLLLGVAPVYYWFNNWQGAKTGGGGFSAPGKDPDSAEVVIRAAEEFNTFPLYIALGILQYRYVPESWWLWWLLIPLLIGLSLILGALLTGGNATAWNMLMLPVTLLTSVQRFAEDATVSVVENFIPIDRSLLHQTLDNRDDWEWVHRFSKIDRDAWEEDHPGMTWDRAWGGGPPPSHLL